MTEEEIGKLKKENARLKRKVVFLEQSLSQFNSIKSKYDNLIQKIEEKDIKLKVMNEQLQSNLVLLEQLSTTDSLTGLRNRRNFDEVFDHELRRAQRQEYEFNFMILDIDNFKQYNDTYGHKAGDDVLQQIGTILTRFARRSTDFAFRYGGEEFAYISTCHNKNKFFKYCKKILKAIEDKNIEHKFGPCGVVTASAGAVICKKIHVAKEDIFKLADDNLYKSKDNGKNQVTIETI